MRRKSARLKGGVHFVQVKCKCGLRHRQKHTDTHGHTRTHTDTHRHTQTDTRTHARARTHTRTHPRSTRAGTCRTRATHAPALAPAHAITHAHAPALAHAHAHAHALAHAHAHAHAHTRTNTRTPRAHASAHARTRARTHARTRAHVHKRTPPHGVHCAAQRQRQLDWWCNARGVLKCLCDFSVCSEVQVPWHSPSMWFCFHFLPAFVRRSTNWEQAAPNLWASSLQKLSRQRMFSTCLSVAAPNRRAWKCFSLRARKQIVWLDSQAGFLLKFCRFEAERMQLQISTARSVTLTVAATSPRPQQGVLRETTGHGCQRELC